MSGVTIAECKFRCHASRRAVHPVLSPEAIWSLYTALLGWQDNGFKENGQVRRIPFEVMVKGDKQPFYEETLEDAGRFTDQPILPFNAYGTMALARGEFEANSGSSQVFWLLKVSCLGTALFGFAFSCMLDDAAER